MSTWIILLIFFLFSLLLRWKSAAVAENKEEDLLEEDALERDVEEIQAEKSLAEELFAEMRKSVVIAPQPAPKPVPQPEQQPAPQPAQRLAQQPAPKPATQPALKPQPAPQYATQPAPQSKNQGEEGSLLEEIKKNPKNLILYSEIMRPKFKEF